MENPNPPNKTLSPKWYLLPVLIFFLGPLISAYLLYTVFAAAVHTVTFVVPGNAKIFIAEPGEYTLWTVAKSSAPFNKTAADLQKISFSLMHRDTKKTLFFTPQLGWSDITHQKSHYSLGSLKFDQPGYYELHATGNSTAAYKVYLRQPSLIRIIRTLGVAILLTVLSILAAALSAIIILIKRMNRRPMTTETKEIPEQQPPTGKSSTWAMICHLSGFIGFIFPLGNIIAPLLIWGFKRHDSPYIDTQGKEAINFQISITIYYLIATALILIIIGLFLLPLLAAFHIIAMIIAGVETANGKNFRYPLTIRFIQ